MTTKIVKDAGITPHNIEAAKMAYDSYAKPAFVSQFKSGLRRRPHPTISCQHPWLPVERNSANEKFLKGAFEENDLGRNVLFCPRCGAVSLWSDGLWAYDNTLGFFGAPPAKIPSKE